MAKLNGNGELKIDKGIAIPPRRERIGMAATLRRMEVGDSMLIAKEMCGDKNIARMAGYALGIGCYVTRKVDGGVRIWRIK